MITGFQDLIVNELLPAIPRNIWSYEAEDDDILLLASSIKGKTPVLLSESFNIAQNMEDLFEEFCTKSSTRESVLFVIIRRTIQGKEIKEEEALRTEEDIKIKEEPNLDIPSQPESLQLEPLQREESLSSLESLSTMLGLHKEQSPPPATTTVRQQGKAQSKAKGKRRCPSPQPLPSTPPARRTRACSKRLQEQRQ